MKNLQLDRKIMAWCLASLLLVTGIIPAGLSEEVYVCGMEEHVHTDACYAPYLVCGLSESAPGTQTVTRMQCHFQGHIHDASCYVDGRIVCGYAAGYTHVHSSLCYDEQGNLICSLSEVPPHVHTSSCYDSVSVLTCTREEGEGAHFHTDACYAYIPGGDPVCGQEENGGHVHTSACYTPVLVCRQEESAGHQHTESCLVPQLACGLEESAGHQHTDACYSLYLVCDQPETPGHVHGDGCYIWGNVCGIPESEGHIHTDSCYSQVQRLVCMEDHEHTDACFETAWELACGQEESYGHTHDESCFGWILACDIPEGYGAHTHSDGCYQWELSCGLPEGYGAHTHSEACVTYVVGCGIQEGAGAHIHNDACYQDMLTCGIEEGSGVHHHTEACYSLIPVLQCGREETIGHLHTDACYGTESVLACAWANVHAHSAGCFSTDSQGNRVCVCGYEEILNHTHTADCVSQEEVILDEGHMHDDTCYSYRLVCGMPEHVHTDSCLAHTTDAARSSATRSQSEEIKLRVGAIIDLSTLLSQMGIGTISDITFSRPAAGTVAQQGSIWTLTGVAAFRSREVLTVTDGSGAMYFIPVWNDEWSESAGSLSLKLSTKAYSAFGGDPVDYEVSYSGGKEPVSMTVSVYQDDDLVYQGSHVGSTLTVYPQEYNRETNLYVQLNATDADGASAEAHWEMPCAVHDPESRSYWESTLAGAVHTGNWTEDMLSIARTQVGYRESQRDFIIRADGSRQGYTRYGAWYGVSYTEWCACFICFCMKYADIPREELDRFANCGKWHEWLMAHDLWAAPGEAEIRPGDLILFDWETDGSMNHIGIVTWVDKERQEIHTIEGNHQLSVAECTYELSDERIGGFGLFNQAYENYGEKSILEKWIGSD